MFTRTRRRDAKIKKDKVEREMKDCIYAAVVVKAPPSFVRVRQKEHFIVRLRIFPRLVAALRRYNCEITRRKVELFRELYVCVCVFFSVFGKKNQLFCFSSVV